MGLLQDTLPKVNICKNWDRHWNWEHQFKEVRIMVEYLYICSDLPLQVQHWYHQSTFWHCDQRCFSVCYKLCYQAHTENPCYLQHCSVNVLKNAELIAGDETRKEKARKLMTKIVNSLSGKMEWGSLIGCMYLLGNPDHYTNYMFTPFYWKSFVQ